MTAEPAGLHTRVTFTAETTVLVIAYYYDDYAHKPLFTWSIGCVEYYYYYPYYYYPSCDDWDVSDVTVPVYYGRVGELPLYNGAYLVNLGSTGRSVVR